MLAAASAVATSVAHSTRAPAPALNLLLRASAGKWPLAVSP